MNMKFMKGIVLGGIITTGMVMMLSEHPMKAKKFTKKGKCIAKKMGIL